MAEYFSHDYDSREDEKIIDLLSDLGYEGYGIYWAIVEMLYKNKGSLQIQYNRISFALNADIATVEKVIKAYNLFKFNQTHFWSESVRSRLKQRREISEKARESVNYRWNERNTNVIRPKNDRNTINKKKEIKKESSSIERIFKENYNDPKYITKPK